MPVIDVLIGQPGFAWINKFGENTDVDSGAAEDVWTYGGKWVAPTTARTHAIVSASANDAAAGTGLRTVQIEGLDANYDIQTETITMNGTTNVNTANTYTRIYRMKGLTAGSGGTNAGNITATAATDNTVTAHILAGQSQNQMAIYTIPAGKTGYMTNYHASMLRTASNSGCDIELFVRDFGGPWRVLHDMGMLSSGISQFQHIFDPYLTISAKADVVLEATSTADNLLVAGGFDIILINNP
jgi:hypothetical protein